MAFPLSAAEHDQIEAMIQAIPELIVAAAIRTDGRIVMVERPGRHGDCINWLHWLSQLHEDQGFITSHGRFVDRAEAGRIVESVGQTTTRTMVNGHLFSEDVWNDADHEPGKIIRAEDVFAPSSSEGDET